MTKHDVIRLSAGEVAGLWSQYVADTMAACVLDYFRSTAEDPEIRILAEHAMSLSQDHVKKIKAIFEVDNYPVPIGFSDGDYDVNAPRLFTDLFILMYVRQMSIMGMSTTGLMIGVAARSDVSNLFMDIMAQTVNLHDMTRKLQLAKGVYLRPPTIVTPEKAEMIKRQSFLTGFFGEKSPLTAIEITHLDANIETNAMGKAIVLGFAQVTKIQAVKEYMLRAKEIAEKHIKIFSELLTNEDLPISRSWDDYVTGATIAPFSDKLMMAHVAAIAAAGIGNYAIAAAASQRRDLALMYGRMIGEVGLLAEDGVELMIDNGWLEEPPLNANRKILVQIR